MDLWLVPDFKLGNPQLRPWSGEEDVDLYVAKTWAYGADGSRIETGDEVLVLWNSWSFSFCKVDYFTGWHVTKNGLRVIAQTSPDEFEVFAYQMDGVAEWACHSRVGVLATALARVLRPGWRPDWRQEAKGWRMGTEPEWWWGHRDGRVVRAVEEEDDKYLPRLILPPVRVSPQDGDTRRR